MQPSPNALLVGSIVTGILLRTQLFWTFDSNPHVHAFIADRVEISSPVSGFKNIENGIFLRSHDLSPYANDVFHSSPIILSIFEYLVTNAFYLKATFIIIDVITGLCLYFIASSSQRFFQDHFPKHFTSTLSHTFLCSPYFALFCHFFYYLNPLVILVSCCKSTANLSHALISLSISLSIYGSVTLSSTVLALATVLDVYPVLLVPIHIVLMIQCCESRRRSLVLSVTLFVATYLFAVIYLFGFNYKLNGSDWDFIDKFYGFMFFGTDITPNLGCWWYFRMSLFKRFGSFFTIILNLQPIAFMMPTIWRFGAFPFYPLFLMIHQYSVFRVYPVISDGIFGITFLVISSFMFWNHFKHSLLLIIVYCIGLQLMFFMWYMWIEGGVGNANFYYAGNILYNISQLYAMVTSIKAARKDMADRESVKVKSA